jgi:beta-ribofuranosylaminobenzene 5'-phosphate synthase
MGIRTGSRLHLGLLSVPGADAATLGWRSFGGAGLMIEAPALSVRVEPANEWSAVGPAHQRALDFARQTAVGPLRVIVEGSPEEHVGLGSGTQLAMAVALAVRMSRGENPEPLTMAAEMGRGARSGLGVHGFIHGGFLVDGGKGPTTAVAPLLARQPFPSAWGILLATPQREHGLAGASEREAFAQLARQAAETVQSEALCRLVLLGILPALLERDLAAFGEAVFEFNYRAGLLFKASQGGAYRSPAAAALVAELRGAGIRGVGQSSWGPTIFAIEDPERLAWMAVQLRERHPGLDVKVTQARNRGWECCSRLSAGER